jgi:TPP-dependent pyruvate/acetoin dehydrogenase alpha subunit
MSAHDLLRQMILIRRFEERALELAADGLVHGALHPSIGQEAIAVGVCAELERGDRIMSTHRGHGHAIAKGARVDRMMAELFGRQDGYSKGKGGSMHVADFEAGMLGANGIVAGGLPIAAGAALASQLEGVDRVTVAFFGDGATSEGAFHESMNISVLWNLPVVWVCENNAYAANTPLSDTMPHTDAATYADGYAMRSVIVDGNDVNAVRGAAATAVTHARSGRGPTFLEAKTFRRTPHAVRGTPWPDPRPQEEHDYWIKRDPIDRFIAEMMEDGDLDRAALEAIQTDIESILTAAVAFAESSPFPPVDSAFDDVFAV